MRASFEEPEGDILRMLLVIFPYLASTIAPTFAMTCTEALARCIAIGGDKPYIAEACKNSGAFCMKSGRFFGPVSGTHWDNLTQK